MGFVMAEGLMGAYRGRSWAWRAPELFVDHPTCTAASDIYALGVTYWEISSNGMLPVAIHPSPPQPPVLIQEGLDGAIPPDCPIPIAELIAQCCHDDAGQRPAVGTILYQLAIYMVMGTSQSPSSYTSPHDVTALTGIPMGIITIPIPYYLTCS